MTRHIALQKRKTVRSIETPIFSTERTLNLKNLTLILTVWCYPSFIPALSGTLQICVRGDSILPRSLFNSFYIACAILRQVYLTFSLIFYEKEIYDVIFVDQLSACVPLLKLTGAKVNLFADHYLKAARKLGMAGLASTWYFCDNRYVIAMRFMRLFLFDNIIGFVLLSFSR